MYGLDTEDIEAIKKVFSKHSEIESAVLYGSRAKGNYRNDSDIDLTLKGKKITLSQLFEIETELDDLLLPYKIDLSIYHKIENPDFIEHINRVGIIFYKNETNKWKETTLDNHIDLISGYAFKSKDFLENQEEGTLPIIKIKNVANGDVNLKDVVYHKYDESLSKYKLSKGDVLIAMTGNHPQAEKQVVGDVSRYKLEVNALLNQRVGKIVPKGKTDLDFLYYFFKDKDTHRYLANQSSGSANQANISKTNIIGMETEFPEPNEQKAISKILIGLDDKIDLLQNQNNTLEAMAESLFRQWFIEEYDESWEEKSLSSVTDIGIGRTPPRKEFHWFSKSKKDIKWISIKDLGNSGTFILDTSEYLTQKAVEKFNVPVIPSDTVLLSFKMTLGRVAITTEEMLSNEAIAHFKFNSETPFSKEYLYFYLKNYPYISLGSTSSIVTSINSGMIKDLKIAIPNNGLLEKFGKISKDYFNKIKTNQFQIFKLVELRETLLPKLMSGELKVMTDD